MGRSATAICNVGCRVDVSKLGTAKGGDAQCHPPAWLLAFLSNAAIRSIFHLERSGNSAFYSCISLVKRYARQATAPDHR